MTLFTILAASTAFLIIGQLVLLSCDLELRTVCPRIWANAWLFVTVSFVWPVAYLWIRAKWHKKKRNAGLI